MTYRLRVLRVRAAGTGVGSEQSCLDASDDGLNRLIDIWKNRRRELLRLRDQKVQLELGALAQIIVDIYAWERVILNGDR